MQKLKSHKCFEGHTEFYEHQSSTTKTLMKFSVYRPSCSPNQLRGGLIWLSGLTCTDENFITKAGAQRILNDLKLAIICPDTSPRGTNLPGEHDSYDFGSGAGFYVDATTPEYANHYRMYSYVNQELYALFNNMFSLNGRISIMGHSMGGHGALVSGLRNPGQYRSVSAFAPISNPTQSPWGEKALRGYLGDDVSAWKVYDTCELLSAGHKHPTPFLVDQGLADEFMVERLMPDRLEAACKAAGQPLELRRQDGYDHSYYFISSFIGDHLRFHAENLK